MGEPRTLRAKFRSVVTSPIVSTVLLIIGRGSVFSHRARVLLPAEHVSSRAAADITMGFYERHEIYFIRHRLKANFDVVELGSSLGVTSAHILRRISSRNKLIAIEANPRLIEHLRGNLELHGAGRYAIRNVAVAYDAETIDLELDSDHVRSRVRDGEQRSSGIVSVRAMTLKEIVGDLDAFTLMCDIEGGEHTMLRREVKTFERCQQLIIEMHGTVDEISASLEFIESHLHMRQVAHRRSVWLYER